MRAKTRNQVGSLVLVLLAVFPLLAGRAWAVRGPSTPEERAKALKLAHQLEAEPMGRKAQEARRWLALWMVEVPDLRVQFCPEALGGTLAARQRLRSEILAQMTYSSLAFVIASPGKARSAFDVHRAGTLGALRAYEALLGEQPGARAPLLDDLVVKRNAGELDAYLAETVKACRAPK